MAGPTHCKWLSLILLTCTPLCAQIQIRIVEGDGVVYPIGSRATRGITVEVVQRDGVQVEGAVVRFELPNSGASGEFASGGRTASVTTGADGRAQVWGMQWNREVGPLEVRILASKAGATASARAGLSLTRAAVPVDVKSARPGRKKLWITLALAGAAGVAVVGLAGKSPAAAGPTPVNPPQFGTPTVTIGRP